MVMSFFPSVGYYLSFRLVATIEFLIPFNLGDHLFLKQFVNKN